jgi:hypothetical protein
LILSLQFCVEYGEDDAGESGSDEDLADEGEAIGVS